MSVPVEQVTGGAVIGVERAFALEHPDVLFITTSREGLQPGEEPEAGSLFAAQPGVRGLPVREFGG